MKKIIVCLIIITMSIYPTIIYEASAESKIDTVEPRSISCTGYATQSSELGSGITIKVNATWTYRTDGTWNYRESMSTSGAPAGATYSGRVLYRGGDSFSYWVDEWYQDSLNSYLINVYIYCNG